MRIAVDAMGGDHAPRCVIEGAALAIARGLVTPAELLLVGRRAELLPLVEGTPLSAAELLDAPEVVGMDESPAAAIRGKKHSSIVVAMKAVLEKRADAFVSAGNTGACVAASSLVLGRLPGVARPGIAAPMPTRRGPSVVIDVGANIYCKPEHMLQYAIMAGEYARVAFALEEPLIGLLNIGEEEGKGNPLIQQVHALLQSAPLRYKGFVEGQDILAGGCDVVVCEGFVGNVILKVAEGVASFVHDQVAQAFREHPPRPEVGQAVRAAFERLDYAEYGGAPLLGVAAPVLIGHGRSGPPAIANMLRAARAAVVQDVNSRIVERIARASREAPA